jgi:uncharacterized protein YjhX (UPF0386 family)
LGGRLVHRRDPETGKIVEVDCFTRDGWRLSDCKRGVFKRLKRRQMIGAQAAPPTASRAGASPQSEASSISAEGLCQWPLPMKPPRSVGGLPVSVPVVPVDGSVVSSVRYSLPEEPELPPDTRRHSSRESSIILPSSMAVSPHARFKMMLGMAHGKSIGAHLAATG